MPVVTITQSTPPPCSFGCYGLTSWIRAIKSSVLILKLTFSDKFPENLQFLMLEMPVQEFHGYGSCLLLNLVPWTF